jgi:branched-chain amino acid transport system ATP-binding protein
MTQTPAIEANGISKSFSGLRAVSEVTFDVPAGEIFGIIGPNGAGKTTLFNLLSGAIIPDTGIVRLHGRDISNTPMHMRASRGLVRTFQTPRIFESLSCLENVAAGGFLRFRDRKSAFDSAAQALRLLGVDPPWEGLARELNLESRRRIEMARLIATGAKTILLDEPLTGFNHAEIERTWNAVRVLRKQHGITFIIIEHHMGALMSICDRLMAMHFGKKIAEGEPRVVATNQLVREVYLGHKVSTDDGIAVH